MPVDLEPVSVTQVGGRVLTEVVAAYDANERDLFTFALGVTRDGAAAEDIVQEAFLRLVRESRSGRFPDNARAWLYRVVVNLARTRARRRVVADRWRGLFANRDVARSPEDDIVGREGAAILAAVVASLPTDARMAFLLATEGHSGQEVASLLGRSEGATPKNLLWRARREAPTPLGAGGGRMIDHGRFQRLAAVALDFAPSAAEASELDAHLRECAGCRAFAAGIRADGVLARSLPRAHAPDRVRQTVVAAAYRPTNRPGPGVSCPPSGRPPSSSCCWPHSAGSSDRGSTAPVSAGAELHPDRGHDGLGNGTVADVLGTGAQLIAVGNVSDGGRVAAAVWMSADGLSWQQLPADATFLDSKALNVASHGDTLIVLGTDFWTTPGQGTFAARV